MRLLLGGILQQAYNNSSSGTLLNDLVSTWELDEETGSTVVDSHGVNNGTNLNSTTINQTGKINKCYSFNKVSSNNLTIPYNSNISLTTFTLSIWVNLTADSATNGILQSAGGSGYSSGWAMYHYNNTVSFRWGNGTTYQTNINNGGIPSTGGWHNFIITVNGSNIHMYQNNTLVASTSSATLGYSASPSDWNMRVGYVGGLSYAQGLIDQISMWSRVLTESERISLYNDGLGKAYSTWTAGSSSGGSSSGGSGGGEGEPTYTGTGYYFSATGDDLNDGLTTSTPKRSLNAANGLTLNAGDAILFKRGDYWEGELVLSQSGTSTDRIVIGAYGTGNKPKIYGSRVVNESWSVHTGNIYVCSVDLNINQVFLDGVRVQPARYPYNDYHFISSFSGTTITSSTIDNGVDHTGSKVIFRDGYYQTSLRTVTSYNNTTSFVIDTSTDSGLEVNDGFFFMGNLGYLTNANQWYYDDVNNLLYIWTPNGTSPSNYEVRVSVDNRSMYANGRSYFTVDGIEFLQQGYFGSYFVSCNNYTIENCNYYYQEECGHKQDTSNQNVIIRGNHFQWQNGLGLYTYHSQNLLVEENVFEDIGLFEQIGLNGVGEKSSWGSGAETSQPFPEIALPSNNITFRYNRFLRMGYNGVFWRGPALIERNYCEDISLWKQDGAGIYTNTQGDGSTVRENIIINAVGNKYGFWTSRAFSNGIYIDEICPNAIVEYNTCVNSGEAGVKLHRNLDSIIRYNNILDARASIYLLGRSDNSSPGTIDLNNNTCVMNTYVDRDGYFPSNMFVVEGSSPTLSGVLPQFTSNNNKFVYPFTGYDMFKPNSGYSTFTEWQGLGYDAASTLDQTALAGGETYECFYNESKVTKNYNVTGTNVKDVNQNTISSFSLAPYRSIILRGSSIVVTEI